MIAANYPVFDVFVSTLYFAILIAWVILVFHVFQDIMRSPDLTGAARAIWVLFILALPLLGCLLYLIARGGDMHVRQERAVQVQRQAFEDYIRHVVADKSGDTKSGDKNVSTP